MFYNTQICIICGCKDVINTTYTSIAQYEFICKNCNKNVVFCFSDSEYNDIKNGNIRLNVNKLRTLLKIDKRFTHRHPFQKKIKLELQEILSLQNE